MTTPPQWQAAEGIHRSIPLREQVRQRLLQLLGNGTLVPGQHLVEEELAQRLGVSRQPVREALHQMATDGWVDRRPGQGAFVHVPTAAEVRELFAVRTLLEVEAARGAAERGTEEQVAELRRIWEQGNASVAEGDAPAVVGANRCLHDQISAMAGNAVLAELIGSLAVRVNWCFLAVVAERAAGSWSEHAALIEAITAGEADTAGRLMREHVQATQASYERVTPE